MTETNFDSEWTKASDKTNYDSSDISSNESDKLKIVEEESFHTANSKIEILEDVVLFSREKIKCHFCEKNFDKEKFEEHTKVHEFTFFHCLEEGCTKKFKRKSSLRKHQYFHKGIFKYNCKQCDAQFIDLNKFQTHQTVKHKISGSVIFKCREEDCGKSFATSDYLRRHQVTHKGDSNR